MENEIVIKVLLAQGVNINKELYMDIINGLNDRYVPCNEISLNGEVVFNNIVGFIDKKKDEV